MFRDEHEEEEDVETTSEIIKFKRAFCVFVPNILFIFLILSFFLMKTFPFIFMTGTTDPSEISSPKNI